MGVGMNSKLIFEHMRQSQTLTQKQVDALYQLVSEGAKIETIANFVGVGGEQAVNKTHWQLSQKSLDRLKGVNANLAKVVKRAIEISEYDFMVVEGLRSLETQKEYVKKGVSKTLNSYHLTGHAVDLAPLENGAIDWNNKKGQFDAVVKAMKQASRELGIAIECGSDWKSFVDKPHFQITR